MGRCLGGRMDEPMQGRTHEWGDGLVGGSKSTERC